MNFLIEDVEIPEGRYPNCEGKEFLSLDEYIKMARKQISRFASPGRRQQMLKSEDAISKIAYANMTADWKFDATKGKTRYSFRNQEAIFAIKNFYNALKTKANKPKYSIDSAVGENTDTFASTICDDDAKEAVNIIKNQERLDRVEKYVKSIIKDKGSKLTDIEKKCIEYKYYYPNDKIIDGQVCYFTGIESNRDIGNMFTPKISRQAVSQHLENAIRKMKENTRRKTL